MKTKTNSTIKAGKEIQSEFSFVTPKRIRKVNVCESTDRPHHRTTTITVNRASFEKVRKMGSGERVTLMFTNDIVSSAHGGASKVHHTIRRVALLSRQIAGGFNKVKVRCEQGIDVPCFITSLSYDHEDDCYGWATVTK